MYDYFFKKTRIFSVTFPLDGKVTKRSFPTFFSVTFRLIEK